MLPSPVAQDRCAELKLPRQGVRHAGSGNQAYQNINTRRKKALVRKMRKIRPQQMDRRLKNATMTLSGVEVLHEYGSDTPSSALRLVPPSPEGSRSKLPHAKPSLKAWLAGAADAPPTVPTIVMNCTCTQQRHNSRPVSLKSCDRALNIQIVSQNTRHLEGLLMMSKHDARTQCFTATLTSNLRYTVLSAHACEKDSTSHLPAL